MSYEGKKPAAKKIQKQVASISLQDSVADLIDEWEEESDEVFEKRMYAECENDQEEVFAANEDKISEIYCEMTKRRPLALGGR